MLAVKKKRLDEDLDGDDGCAVDPSDITGPQSNVTIRGVVTDISPIKESKRDSRLKYFTGKITDGKKTLRMVSFRPKFRDELQNIAGAGQSVAISECEVKASASSALEVISSRASGVKKCEKKFDLPDDLSKIDPETAVSVKLEELQGLCVNQVVNVKVKVCTVNDAEDVSHKGSWRQLTKQDCMVVDHSNAVRAVLWTTKVGCFEEGRSYEVKNATVRVYNDIKYLSLSEKSELMKIDDIGVVVQLDQSELETVNSVVLNGEIVSVVAVEEYRSCISCGSKIKDEAVASVTVVCTRCAAVMKANKCISNKVARIVVESEGKNYNLTIFNDVLDGMTGGKSYEGVADCLLGLPLMNFSVSKTNIVRSARVCSS